MGWRGLCICSQGCTKACIGAITLDSLLRSPGLKEATTIPDKFGSNFFKIHADKISGAWYGLFLFFFHPCTESSICWCREGTKPTGTAFNIFISHLWPRILRPKYRLSVEHYPSSEGRSAIRRAVRGRVREHHHAASEDGQSAQLLIFPWHHSFSDTCASIWNKGQERWFGTLACSVLLGATDDTHAAVRVVEGGAFQGEGISRLSSWKIDANHDTHTCTKASSLAHALDFPAS